ncbi:MAG TPA: NAD(P)-binding protein, partial [Candidatus Binataceae bacterium]|nr:NAD(P)-binding protein [Candidatus Binataceae bacterium]
MKCATTQTPDGVDIPSRREKYRQERDKRIRSEGQTQYVRPIGDFAENYAADPHTPVAPRSPLAEDIDVAIVGAGWTGILAAYQLKKAGVGNIRTIDHAGGFGGVWYWNRYPG